MAHDWINYLSANHGKDSTELRVRPVSQLKTGMEVHPVKTNTDMRWNRNQ